MTTTQMSQLCSFVMKGPYWRLKSQYGFFCTNRGSIKNNQKIMKTNRLVFSKISAGALVSAMALSALIYGTAFAATTPSVNVSINNESNANVTSVPVGTVVHLNTSVSSSTGPVATGTIDFSSYANTTCSGTATVQTGVALVNGGANSATTTVGSNGLSYKASYVATGDVYSSTTSSCVSVQAVSTGVTLNTTLSTTTVVQGTSVSQSSALNGATANATGTVSYGFYTNNSCSANRVLAGVKNVSSAVVPQSDLVQFNTVGTFYWRADYSGDQFNNAVNGPCQTLSVLSSSTPVTPTPVGPGSLSGTAYNDLNKNRTRDNGEAGISGFTIKLYGGTFWWNWGKPKAVATTTTDANGNYSFTGLQDGLYRIEEIKLNGWNQISSDYRWVLLINGKSLTGLDFANTAKVNASSTATTTPPRKDDDHKNKGQEKKEEQREKKINKLFEKINKIENKGKGNGKNH